MRLINDDFPVLGMPTTIKRSGLPAMPFWAFASILSLSTRRTVGAKAFKPLPERQSTAIAVTPCLPSSDILRRVAFSSARSHLLRMTMSGFCPISSGSSGLRLLTGTRASTISATASTSGRLSFICLRVRAI